MAKELRKFYTQKLFDYQVFINGEKQRRRKKEDLEKYRKMKVIAECIESIFPTLDWDEKVKFHCEATFKLSKINFNNLHRLFARCHPMGNYVQKMNL